MLDDVTDRQRYGLVVAAVALLGVGFAGGAVYSNGGPTGNAAASTAEIRQTVTQVMDQQMARQRQRLRAVANRSANLSVDDVSMDASVDAVEPSQFGSLYKVTVSVQGQVPRRLGSGTRQIDQTQELYVSSDGRYLFRPPTDLQQPQQPTTGTQPSTSGQ